MQSPIVTDRLADFLRQPNIEASPAWEFINGRAQKKLCKHRLNLTVFYHRLF